MRGCCRLLLLSAGLLVWLFAVPARASDGGFAAAAEQARRCGVSGAAVNALTEGVARRDLDEAQAGALLKPLLDACAEKLPLASIEDKLVEGLAKHVPPAGIVPVLRKRVADYRLARSLLAAGRADDPEALVLVGEGLAMGTPETDFKTYLATFGRLPAAAFRIGLAMTAYQGQVGFDPALTRRIVREGVESGALDGEWRYFVRVVLAARRRGLTDAVVADAAVAVLRAGGPVTDVVVRLGFTGRSLSGLPE